MIDDDQKIPGGREEWDKEVRDKLDATLRRFIELEDDALRDRVERDRARLIERREQITRDFAVDADRLTGPEDRRAIRRVRDLRLRELVPDRLAGIVLPGPLEPARARAIVRFTGNRSDLEAMGLSVRAQAQDVFTVTGTRSQLFALANEPACRRLRAPRIMGSTVEDASAQAEVADVHDPRPLNPTGFRGDGTAVGIVDGPLDVTHHGFREPTGAHGSRVLYYWVQTPHIQDAMGDTISPAVVPGQTPEQWYLDDPTARPDFTGLDYGRLYTQADIDAALGLAGGPYGNGANEICCEPTRTNEHGTHVAGIAAGNGHLQNWVTAPVRIGAAPEAAIIHVRKLWVGNDVNYDETYEDAMFDGIDFCMRAAAFENLPIAVNVSSSTTLGAHCGTSDFDLGRDRLLTSFDLRSIVTTPGNENDEDGYRTAAIAAGGTDSFTLTAIEHNNFAIYLELWYSGPELDYQITFSGDTSGWRTAGQDYDGTLGGKDIEAERDVEAAHGFRGIRMYFDEADIGDTFTIDLRNPHGSQSADYHAWVGYKGKFGRIAGATKDKLTITDTACCKSVLTVGAAGKVHPPNPASGETVTFYSGAGPTLDGRIKPEIVAVGGTPGDWIWSTASDENSGYTGMVGTSMSAPLVAGSIALLFEEYTAQGYSPNQDTVKALLTQHANRLNLHIDPADAAFDEEHRDRYGYGRLRMIGPIDTVRPPVDVDLWIRTADDDYGEMPYPGGCFCGAPDIRVCASGTDTEITQLTWGTTYDVKIRVRNLGDTDAVGATLTLKYTLPHAAPDTWFEAEDASNAKLNRTVDVPAMDDAEFTFQWRPEAAEIGAGSGATHFCLLAEIDHTADPLVYTSPSTGGGAAWATNIKGTNNVALQNLHIQ